MTKGRPICTRKTQFISPVIVWLVTISGLVSGALLTVLMLTLSEVFLDAKIIVSSLDV